MSPTGIPADEVAGQVFRITPAELAAADDYEVSDYKRVLAPLKSGKKAWVYVRAIARCSHPSCSWLEQDGINRWSSAGISSVFEATVIPDRIKVARAM